MGTLRKAICRGQKMKCPRCSGECGSYARCPYCGASLSVQPKASATPSLPMLVAPSHVCGRCHTAYAMKPDRRFAGATLGLVVLFLLIDAGDSIRLDVEKAVYEVQEKRTIEAQFQGMKEWSIKEHQRKADVLSAGLLYIEREQPPSTIKPTPYPEPRSRLYELLAFAAVLLAIGLLRIGRPCPSCGARQAIPVNSPAGKRI
jgi:hypothetical protein